MQYANYQRNMGLKRVVFKLLTYLDILKPLTVNQIITSQCQYLDSIQTTV